MPISSGHVGARPVLEEEVGVADQVDLLGVGHDQLAARLRTASLISQGEDGMRGRGVGADGQDAVRLGDLVDRVGHRAAAE